MTKIKFTVTLENANGTIETKTGSLKFDPTKTTENQAIGFYLAGYCEAKRAKIISVKI